MYRVIVCGSRNFIDWQMAYERLDSIIGSLDDVEIISGGCRGADKIGERYAADKRLPLKVFPADWDKYGRSAGPIRNKLMLKYALQEHAIVVAFWNGESHGTKCMITMARKSNAEVFIIQY